MKYFIYENRRINYIFKIWKKNNEFKFPEPSPTPEIMNKILKLLEENGHTCGEIEGWTTHELKKRRKERAEECNRRVAFASELREKGHKCVFIMESYPPQIGWCRQEICRDIDKNDENNENE